MFADARHRYWGGLESVAMLPRCHLVCRYVVVIEWLRFPLYTYLHGTADGVRLTEAITEVEMLAACYRLVHCTHARL